jgi:uncharacterized protein YeaO (DUF488 family)
MKTQVVTVLLSLIAIGCATPEQQAALEGGVGGAASGYLLCKLLGGDDKKCVAAAVVAATAVGVISYSYASSLKKWRKELVGKENDLDARLRYVRGVNEDTEKLNQQLCQRVTQVTRHTDQVVASIQRKSISPEQLSKERDALDNEVKAANTQVALVKRALDDMKRFQAQQARKSRELDAEIAELQRLYAKTQRETSALASQRQRI